MLDLSKTYADACGRMHQAATDLYERLHTNDGDPKDNLEHVLTAVNEYKRWVLIEVDLVREACRERNEQGV
jgi:hypothetical protein